MSKKQQEKTNKKLEQFLQEIEEVQQKYQYHFKAKLEFTTDGIKPFMVVAEIVPEKEDRSKKKNKKKGGKK